MDGWPRMRQERGSRCRSLRRRRLSCARKVVRTAQVHGVLQGGMRGEQGGDGAAVRVEGRRATLGGIAKPASSSGRICDKPSRATEPERESKGARCVRAARVHAPALPAATLT